VPKPKVIIALSALVATIINPSSAYAQTHEPNATASDQLVIAADISGAVTLDPNQAFENADIPVVHELYSNLVTYEGDNTSTVEPQLATSWTITDHDMVYTFQLKHGVDFANGDPLTASDVVYSLERAVNLTNSPPEYLVGDLGITPANVTKLVTAPNPYEVRIELGTPLSPGGVLAILTYPTTAVVDQKEVAAHAGNDWGHVWLTDHSAGSGPYVLQSWAVDSQIVLTANENYSLGPVPALKRVVWTQVATSAAQYDLLEKRGADVAELLTSAELSQISKRGAYRTLPIPQEAVVYLGLNTQSPSAQRNPLVWNAVKYAIDYEGLTNEVLSGEATPLQSMIPAGMFGHYAVEPYTYNLAEARRLLAEAGLKSGYTVTLSTFNTSIPGAGPALPSDIASFVQADLSQVGITAKIQLLESSELSTQFRAGALQMSLVVFSEDYPDPSDFVGPFGIYSDHGVASFLHWDSPKSASLAEQASELPNGPTRLAVLTAFQKYLQANSPEVPLYQPVVKWAVASDLTDVYVNNPIMGIQIAQLKRQ
jgi:peptide/nickel transport system substrate-binding protein